MRIYHCILILLCTIKDVEKDITTKDLDLQWFVPNVQLDPTVTERMLNHALLVLMEKQQPMKEVQENFIAT